MSKVPLIVFSGGMDSSYLLQEALKEGDAEVLYVKMAQAPEKVVKELAARQEIIRTLEGLYPGRVTRQYLVDIGWMFAGEQQWAFRQPAAWLFGALEVVDYNKHSEVQLGYVAGDQMAGDLSYLSNAWDSLIAISRHDHVPMNFPIRRWTKQMVLNAIDPVLMQHVWVCETPDSGEDGFVACGSCGACQTQDAMFYIYNKNNAVPYKERMAEAIQTYIENQANKTESSEESVNISELVEIKPKRAEASELILNNKSA